MQCVSLSNNVCVCWSVSGQASRTVIHSADITFQMMEDWRNVDLNSITKQTLYTMEDTWEEHRRLIIDCKATDTHTRTAAATQMYTHKHTHNPSSSIHNKLRLVQKPRIHIPKTPIVLLT